MTMEEPCRAPWRVLTPRLVSLGPDDHGWRPGIIIGLYVLEGSMRQTVGKNPAATPGKPKVG